MLQVVIYVVTAAIACAGLLDFAMDEKEYRRAPLNERPKLRKRIAQGMAVFGAVALALLTWRVDLANDKKEDTLRLQLAEVSADQKEMDRAANAVAQSRVGMRAGLELLQTIAQSSERAGVRHRAKALVESVAADYDRSLRRGMAETGARSGAEILAYYGLRAEMAAEPLTLPTVVKVIRTDHDLNRISCAFLAFSEMTGSKVGMFDFEAVETWCTSNDSQCGTVASRR